MVFHVVVRRRRLMAQTKPRVAEQKSRPNPSASEMVHYDHCSSGDPDCLPCRDNMCMDRTSCRCCCVQKRERSDDSGTEWKRDSGGVCRGFYPAVTPFSAAVEAAAVGWLPWHVAELEHDAGSDGGDEERVGDDEEKRQRSGEVRGLAVTVAQATVGPTAVVSGGRPFACSLCEYRCSRKSDLVVHERVHSGEKPFACSVCEYRCSRKPRLVKHERVHSGEKPFACSLCEYHCSRKLSLVLHERVHSGNKPFVCSLCEYRCSRKSDLVVHERVHRGEKPFACSLGEQPRSDKSKLMAHAQGHSGMKLFV